MYEFIIGLVKSKHKDHVIVENNGIGYKLFCSTNSIEQFDINNNVLIYTYLNVREDDFSLFGFYDTDEREVFTALIKVPKIGPKVAISILSGLSVNDFKLAITNADVNRLTKAPGIGKKTAEKLIVELKDKFSANVIDINSGINTVHNSKKVDLIEVLMGLGYNENEIGSMISNMTFDDCDLNELIRIALRHK